MLSAFYRSTLALSAGVPAAAARAARESVSGGVEAGSRLPGAMGRDMAQSARQAFTRSMHITTLTGAALMAAGAVVALITLRGVPAVIEDRTQDGDRDPQDTRSELVLR